MKILYLCAFLVGVSLVVRSSRRSPHQVDEAVYGRAYDSVGQSQVLRIMVSASRRFSGLPSIHAARSTPLYRSLERKLLASGGAFGDSVEIYLGVQIAAALLAAGVLLILLVVHPGALVLLAGLLFAVALGAYPYDQVRRRVKERGEEVTDQLPDFAELLLMPLALGMGIVPALRFTVSRFSGRVADEFDAMLLLIESQALDDERAPFLLAGARLGTPEAVSFCNALMMAHIEGTEVAKNISAQAQSLRQTQFQHARARAKKLPVTLVVLFTVNLLPLLFAVILIPVVVGFSKAFGG